MITKMNVNREPTQKSLFIWNMIGSLAYAFGSMVLTYMTIRIVGEVKGGVFGISLTLAQMFVFIAYFEMRNFQVTDAGNQYSFDEYHTVKVVNCVLMMLVCTSYVLLKGYDVYKCSVIILVCIYRMLDGYADVYEAEFQTRGRLDLAGKSMAFRTILSIVVYFGVLTIAQNVLWAMVCAILSGVMGILLFDIRVFKCVGKVDRGISYKNLVHIWRDCFPLFVGMFLWTYLLSASRIAVDNAMTSEYQSYFQVLFLPVSVINLLAGFMIRPSLLELTDLYAQRKKTEFYKRILKIFLAVGIFTIVSMVGAYLVGITILEWIVKCKLSNYRIAFSIIIFAFLSMFLISFIMF